MFLICNRKGQSFLWSINWCVACNRVIPVFQNVHIGLVLEPWKNYNWNIFFLKKKRRVAVFWQDSTFVQQKQLVPPDNRREWNPITSLNKGTCALVQMGATHEAQCILVVQRTHKEPAISLVKHSRPLGLLQSRLHFPLN